MASEKANRVAKNTLMNYLRMGAGMIITLYTSRVVLNTLGVEDYGISNVVGGIIGMLNIIIYSMQTGTQRFLNVAMGKGDEEQVHHVFCVSMTIQAIIAFLVLLFGETIGLWFLLNKIVIPEGREFAAFWVYQFAIISTMTSVMSAPYSAEVIAHERMGIFAYFTILGLTLKLIIVYMLVVSPFDKLITYSFLNLCAALLNRFLFTWYCRRNFKECYYSTKFPRPLVKEMLSFSAWDLFGVIAWTCSTQGTTILLNLFFGPAVNAAKGIAVSVQSSVKSFSDNFLSALNPQITKSQASGDYAYLHKIMYGGAKLSFMLLFALVLPLIIDIKYVLYIWLNIVPDYTAVFVQILLVEMIFDSMMTPLNTAALATGRIRYYGFATSMMTILALGVYYVVLRLGCSPLMVFVLEFCVMLAREIVQFYKLGKLINFSYTDYFKNVQLKCFFIVLCSVPIPFFIHNNYEESFIRLCFITLVSFPFVLILSYVVLLNKEEQSMAVRYLQNFRNKILRIK